MPPTDAPSGLDLTIRAFEPGDEGAFRALNEEWISKYFGMEDKDRVILADPIGRILQPGGRIYIALHDDEPIGCCALIPMEPSVFELAKMAVSENYRSQGIGRRLLEYVIIQSKAQGARRLYLETNSSLRNAIHLYESVGFRHLPPERVTPSPYARADVYMEMLL
jgi:GNAT superfamily N-acetyltransferase